jgi:phosphatidylglycerophosphate synthase
LAEERAQVVMGGVSGTQVGATSEKFAPGDRYFNVSELWIFYHRRVLGILYRLGIPHEAVTVLSLLCGLAAVWSIARGRFLVGAVLLHFKDVFDACDGALARMTGRAHRIGRFMDSVFDFVALTAAVFAMAYGTAREEAAGPEALLLAVVAALSLFLQCSYFNYHQIQYMETLEDRRLTSTVNESVESERDREIKSAAGRCFLAVLRRIYLVVYGWQDRLMRVIDEASRRAGVGLGAGVREWYGNKRFMTLASALCFGTHIFIMVVALLLSHPRWALYVIVGPMNLYWGGLMLARVVMPRGAGR